MRPRISFEDDLDRTSTTKKPSENFLIRFGIAKDNIAATKISVVIFIVCICIILFTLRILYSDTDTADLPPRNPPAQDVRS